MPLTTLAGHPLHPQLVALPLGMLPFSFAMDVMYLATGKKQYADSAYHSLAGGCLAATAAAASGAVDYLDIPANTRSKKTANLHALLNLSVMGLYGVNLMLRKKKASGVLPTLLSALGTAGLVVSQWYGGKLVYELGMRVKPLMEGETGTEFKLPGDRRIQDAFEQLEKRIAPKGRLIG
jgi:uncharacterized membrane protein